MPTNYHEEITKLLDSAGLIDKTLSFGCEFKTNLPEQFDKQIVYRVGNGYLADIAMKSEVNQIGFTMRQFTYAELFNNPRSEILGHPWDLREVMAWFWKKGILGELETKQILNLDLSKPLSQQDLKPLWELMKSISDNK